MKICLFMFLFVFQVVAQAATQSYVCYSEDADSRVLEVSQGSQVFWIDENRAASSSAKYLGIWQERSSGGTYLMFDLESFYRTAESRWILKIESKFRQKKSFRVVEAFAEGGHEQEKLTFNCRKQSFSKSMPVERSLGEVIMHYEPAQKEQALSWGGLKESDFDGNGIHVYENNRMDIMKLVDENSVPSLVCYIGEGVIAKKIVERMILNTDGSKDRFIASYSILRREAELLVSFSLMGKNERLESYEFAIRQCE